MTEAVTQILAQIHALSPAERAEVVRAVLRSLEPAEEGAEAAWEAELARRTAEIRDGKVTGKPAEQLFTGLKWQTLRTQ
jgi:putative addiction module component (TIGR02574 family)